MMKKLILITILAMTFVHAEEPKQEIAKKKIVLTCVPQLGFDYKYGGSIIRNGKLADGAEAITYLLLSDKSTKIKLNGGGFDWYRSLDRKKAYTFVLSRDTKGHYNVDQILDKERVLFTRKHEEKK